jgi:hypothetical protein
MPSAAPRSPRVPLLLAGAAIAVLALVVLLSAASQAPLAIADPEGRVLFSLLALGDTGDPPRRFARDLQQQMRVARALTAEAERRPADALILLGDNFYPDGLHEAELESRIRSNLVEPYCAFLDLSAPLSPQVAAPCEAPVRPIPLYAVLGNHDRETPESPRLEREAVPRYVANWHLSEEPELVEMGEGVSLVLYDPRPLAKRGDFEPLLRAVRAARGPWRILVSHYPFTERWPAAAARRALAGVGVPVQLHLAGHEHNLGIGVIEGAQPMLQVVAGSGSDLRYARQHLEGRRFFARLPGFARVDLVEGPSGQRLVVSLVATREFSWQVWQPSRVVSRWSVDLEGRATNEDGALLRASD